MLSRWNQRIIEIGGRSSASRLNYRRSPVNYVQHRQDSTGQINSLWLPCPTCHNLKMPLSSLTFTTYAGLQVFLKSMQIKYHQNIYSQPVALKILASKTSLAPYYQAIAALRPTDTFWGVLNVSLRAPGTQLGLTYFFVLSLYFFLTILYFFLTTWYFSPTLID